MLTLVKKQSIRLVSAIIIATMMLSVFTPFIVRAEEPEKKMNVFSIDAGRKYFSVKELKAMIDQAHMKGFTDFHLLLGNDGLRFILDDMSLEVNGKSYTSENVAQAIRNGNNIYYNDANGNALTEAEMDELIAYANKKSMKIIPAINSPGHMDAMLEAMESLGVQNAKFVYRGTKSARTVDLDNDEAVAFTKALVGKYIDYFSGKVEIFNFGADEYANDATSAKGWTVLQVTGKYGKFIDYVNEISGMIKAKNMKPMAFNDGFYYKNETGSGTFDKDIIISLWTAGWNGYDVAKAKFLVDKGHQILNTNDDWYFVLGRINSGWYKYTQAMEGINKSPYNKVTGTNLTDNIPIIGSMVCVWCDEPRRANDPVHINGLMDAFSKKNPDQFIRLANYTEVEKAIEKVNALTKEDYKDFSAVEAAVAAVVADKPEAEQSVVDGYAKAINDALAALEIKDADYSKVDAAIEKAEALTKENYKDFSAVTAAVNAVVRGKTVKDQVTVDNYAKAINDAIDALELKDADYSKVDAAIAEIPEDLTLFTDESLEALTAAKEAVVRDKKIDEQETVDGYAKAIKEAVDGLKYKKAGYDKVDAAIAKANGLKKTDYKDFTPVTNAIDAVIRDKDITEQETVDAYAKAINDAIDALELKDADYEKVNAAIAKADGLTKENYVDFSGVTDAVDAVVTGKKIDEQEAVDAYAKAINEAIDALELKPASYTKVDEAIAKIPADLSIYTKDSADAVKAAKNAVVKDKKIDQQEMVDGYAKAIEDAIEKLVVQPTIIEGANQEVKQGNPATFKSSADFKDFEKVLVDGKEISEEHYTAVSGSTVVTLKPAYTSTLAVGKHILSIVSKNAAAETEFTVSEKSDDNTGNGGNGNNNGENNGGANGKDNTDKKADTPAKTVVKAKKTGDAFDMVLWGGALAVSASGIVALFMKRRQAK